MSNPLVAQRQDSTTSLSGVPILESVDETRKAVESGDWAAGVMGAVGTGLDALGMALDPFGAILAAGVGWLMEHVGPVSDALDALTGDPDEIKAHSETWKKVAAELDAVRTEMTDVVKSDTASWTGQAGDAYRARSEDIGALIEAAKSAAQGAADGIATAGEVVGAVRTLVRDIIAELVGHLVSWALQVLATLGVGMTWVVPQVVAEVAKVAARIADITSKLVRAFKALTPLLKKLGKGFGDAGDKLRKIKADGSSAGPGKTPPPPKTGNGDAPATTRSTGADGAGGDGPASTRSANNDSRGGSGQDRSSRFDNDSASGDRASPGPIGSRGGGNGPAGTRSTSSNRSLRDQEPNRRSPNKLRCEKDPIDVATGQMVLSQVDAEFLGALPLVVERTHFSAFRTGRWFGRSWTSMLDQRLEIDASGVSFAAADGTLHHFPAPAPGSWADGPGSRRLGRTDSGAYLISDREQGLTLHFTTNRLDLSSITDVRGDRIDVLRHGAGTPTEIRHGCGYRVRVETTGGLVTALHSIAADGEVELMRYRYEDARLVEVTNASGRPMRFEYDEAERITSWTDRNGEWYRYTYDERGRCVRTDGSGGCLSGTMEYDSENRITRSIDSLGHCTEFHLNELGQVVKEVDPLGNAVISGWDAEDRLLSRIDALGRVRRNEYDARPFRPRGRDDRPGRRRRTLRVDRRRRARLAPEAGRRRRAVPLRR